MPIVPLQVIATAVQSSASFSDVVPQKGKGLQIQLTVEDKGAFTMPWSATLTFQRALDEWRELVCAENTTANKPDF